MLAPAGEVPARGFERCCRSDVVGAESGARPKRIVVSSAMPMVKLSTSQSG